MALQDVCGFHDTPAYPRWNSPALLSLPVGDTILHFQRGFGSSMYDFGDARSAGKTSGNALELYVPVLDYLSQSPINFGQIASNTLPSHPPLFQSPTPLSPSCLPVSIPLLSSSIPPSPSVPLPFPLSHGTTTLAFAFQGGAIAAADTRSSCGGLVACPASHKVLPVHSHMVGTTSGTSADCALWKRILARECRLYQLRHRRRLTVGGSAKLLSHMLHPFKGTELCVAATLCGWDGEVEGGTEDKSGGRDSSLEQTGLRKGGWTQNMDNPEQTLVLPTDSGAGEVSRASREIDRKSVGGNVDRAPGGPPATAAEGTQDGGSGYESGTSPAAATRAPALAPGPRLCYVCSDGTLLKGGLFSVGSGSPYAYSVLDAGLRWELSVPEACSLAREAVFRATHRDAYSGNCVDLFHITARGWRRRAREDLKEEYYREKERERERVEERRRERERVEERK
ncbi:proteasome subunit beta type-11b [Paramormyrops kingsleyae]|uniref:proteasome subunit beta type-11b n=1 Tax=Paramormyrops kingsleyae TaxID=1676925 RepID=UPI000CD5F680|nr:uncharacterized protein LOC111857143 [Paramormyrops kingsleyae]